MPSRVSLPIDEVLPALRLALAERHEAVLEAPPGAGKTTRVPLALLDEHSTAWLRARPVAGADAPARAWPRVLHSALAGYARGRFRCSAGSSKSH